MWKREKKWLSVEEGRSGYIRWVYKKEIREKLNSKRNKREGGGKKKSMPENGLVV